MAKGTFTIPPKLKAFTTFLWLEELLVYYGHKSFHKNSDN